jgi:multifunctional 2-oxoglutarate metabolism enzyme
MKLRDILGVLRDSYCRTIGIEYMHIQDPSSGPGSRSGSRSATSADRARSSCASCASSTQAEAFETFLQTKYVGQKRFSLEGGESVIPLLDAMLTGAPRRASTRSCIGMPHRGRLNVLANIAGKSYGQIFREFEGNIDPSTVQGSGRREVPPRHRGDLHDRVGDKIEVYLAANPSHLEAVNPVLEGIVRAKQDRSAAARSSPCCRSCCTATPRSPGQGVVAETLNLSQLRGYRTGGTVHVVVNNQVGFTTAPESSPLVALLHRRRPDGPGADLPRERRRPRGGVRVARLAFEFRQAFNKDVVIDLVCYRRRGHNEGDDPSMTPAADVQPHRAKRSVRKLYTEALIGRGDITVEEAEERCATTRSSSSGSSPRPEKARGTSRPSRESPSEPRPGDDGGRAPTRDHREVVKRIVDAHVNVPEGFTSTRARSAAAAARADDHRRRDRLGLGETLAFGSLLMEGAPGAPGRAGQPSRHLRPAPRRHRRPRDRRGVDTPL